MIKTVMKTKSGLAIPLVEADVRGAQHTYAREHPWVVRFTHWLNAITLAILIASGLEIFSAFPSFGPKIPQADLLRVPSWLRLGGWLGGALQWHFTFMWVFITTGAVYIIFLFSSGRWRQVLLLPRDLPGVWPMARHYFFFGPRPAPTEPYNPLQKLAYTLTIGCGIVSIVTGLALYQPVQLAWLVRLLGGFRLARLWHFAAMCGFLAFIPGHLIMVALHGWGNFYAMLTGWKRGPAYLGDMRE
jgi:Ni/Fe-hydrogenase b-type cytochrome subunit